MWCIEEHDESQNMWCIHISLGLPGPGNFRRSRKTAMPSSRALERPTAPCGNSWRMRASNGRRLGCVASTIYVYRIKIISYIDGICILNIHIVGICWNPFKLGSSYMCWARFHDLVRWQNLPSLSGTSIDKILKSDWEDMGHDWCPHGSHHPTINGI